jgi:hypothetical protein
MPSGKKADCVEAGAGTLYGGAALSHRSPDLLRVVAGKRHVILCCGAALEVEMEQSSAKVRFPDEIEIDRHFTGPFFILHFDKSHHSRSLVLLMDIA